LKTSWTTPDYPTRPTVRLGEDEGAGERAGEACTLRRFHWALLVTREGVSSLNVPMLDASRFGQRLRFPGPSVSYHAAALPAWLPAHVPPVVPVVHAEPLPLRWPLQRPLSWRVEVVGGYSAEGLKALLDLQLRESPALGVYPPLIEAIPPDDPNSPLTGYAVTLFLQPRAGGKLKLPTLHLPWYDVTHDQMASVTLAGKTLTVFDPRWQLGWQVAGGLAGVLLLAGLIWQTRRMARWRLARRRGLRAIRQARDVNALARAVRRFSLTGRPCAPSLGEWMLHMRRETEASEVEEAVCHLQQQLFGRVSHSMAELQQALMRALARARPKSRFPWHGTQ